MAPEIAGMERTVVFRGFRGLGFRVALVGVTNSWGRASLELTAGS